MGAWACRCGRQGFHCKIRRLCLDRHTLGYLASFLSVFLQLKPLAWALSFGACLGANSTLMGAAANAVALNLAKKKGFQIRPRDFSRYGVPMMLVSAAVATAYSLLAFGLGGYGGQ